MRWLPLPYRIPYPGRGKGELLNNDSPSFSLGNCLYLIYRAIGEVEG